MGSEVFVIPAIFLGLPWIIMHYITKWKTAATITNDDEHLLDELYQLAKRLDERMDTVERLVGAGRLHRHQRDLVAAGLHRPDAQHGIRHTGLLRARPALDEEAGAPLHRPGRAALLAARPPVAQAHRA